MSLIQMTQDFQQYSSMNTSINAKKLPVVFKKIDYSKLPKNFTLLDYGCGRYVQHIYDFIKQKGGVYVGYDKYWFNEEANKAALNCSPDIITCSNLLCVIKEDEIIQDIVSKLLSYNVPVVFTVYEGDKSGIGKPTTKGYQRNQPLGDYCLHHSLITYHGVITNDKSIIL